MNLEGKVVIITGGSKGLGLAMAKVLVAKKATVVICGRNAGELAKAGTGLGIKSFVADVTEESQLSEFSLKCVELYGKIDIWINNAGIWMPREDTEKIDMEKGRNLFNVNVFGTMNGTRVALRQMKLQGGGTIVNIISTTAFDGMNGSSGATYVASKYALRGFTNALKDEYKDSNIKIIGVYPGGIKTDLFNSAPPENLDQFMQVDEVAEKIIKNLESPEPELQLVISRPGQTISHELRSITQEN